MLIASFILLFAVLTAAIFTLGAAINAPASVIASRVQGLLGHRFHVHEKLGVQERVEQVIEPLSRLIPKSPEEVSATRALLIQAGYREDRHFSMYMALRILLAALGLAVVVFTGIVVRNPLASLAFPVLGYMLPRFLLKRMISRRQQEIKLALPDALDLAVVCVESGLALDQSINRVASELVTVHPALSEEFSLVNLEMRAGKPRSEALRNLALRTGVDDVRALVAVLVQTDRFGTSVAAALRVHSDSLRTERRQRAEEQAAKTTIKMVPVLVFFIFPAIFIAILGPAVIQGIRVLGPAVHR